MFRRYSFWVEALSRVFTCSVKNLAHTSAIAGVLRNWLMRSAGSSPPATAPRIFFAFLLASSTVKLPKVPREIRRVRLPWRYWTTNVLRPTGETRTPKPL